METLYSDDRIVVINKPSRMLSVPGRTLEFGESATTRVGHLFGEIHVVHRLDCETSGVMVFARDKDALRHLHKQFQNRQTEKEYIAIVHNTPQESGGRIELPLICDWPNRPKQKVDFESGKASTTDYEVISEEKDQCRIKLTPITGRSHQLRVHMMELGHPILGDSLYAPDAVKAMSDRLCLHATKLTITHPETEEVMTFQSSPDF